MLLVIRMTPICSPTPSMKITALEPSQLIVQSKAGQSIPNSYSAIIKFVYTEQRRTKYCINIATILSVNMTGLTVPFHKGASTALRDTLKHGETSNHCLSGSCPRRRFFLTTEARPQTIS